MRKLIKSIPFLGLLSVKIYRKIKRGPRFISSGNYWEERYNNGGDSGAGSYNQLAKFKANIINDFVQEKMIDDTLELGCGDGNQLKYLKFNKYKGMDVSPSAIKRCEELYSNDPTKTFEVIGNSSNAKYDLVLSLDVIYHLVEDDVYERYMNKIFDSAKKYVIIYSSNYNEKNFGLRSEHVRHRKFSSWIERNAPEFLLVNKVLNDFQYNGDGINTSLADFYFYEK
ncbi:class I SAM-dependent methyltransferase [bacterium]|nr:class I SAM-dependent methyltransferase [bacterium]